MIGPGFNLITAVVGFVLSAAFILFVFSRLICVRLRHVEPRPTFQVEPPPVNLELARREMNGVEPVGVASIPTLKFDQEASGSGEDVQCTICLGEYRERESLGIMPRCGHSFHLSCIYAWLVKKPNCPVCRLSVQDDGAETKRGP